MSKKSTIISKEQLINQYLIENKTVKEIAEFFDVGTATISRLLKQYEIKKLKEQCLANISKTKQAKTVEEKAIYSQHISEARKGKGLGKCPWNKGKHTGNNWTGKHHTEESKLKISQTKNNKTQEEKEAIEAKRRASRVYGDPWNKGKHTGTWTDEQKAIILAKQYVTKKANNSFNTSKPEDMYYEVLVEKYGENDVIRQYSTDSRYPFNCDFYIISEDLFIELNISWTHGGHPFDGNSDADILKLNSWKLKAEISDYYKNAIETWTIRDVNKHKAVRENSLNYIEYYDESELFDI